MAKADGRVTGPGNPKIGTPEHQAKYAGEMGKGGRASFRLNEAVLTRVLGLIQMGNYKQTAAKACGVSPVTLRQWEKRGIAVFERLVAEFGEDEALTYDVDSECPWTAEECHPNEWLCLRLALGMEKAEAEAEAFAVGQVRSAMQDNWTAAMTFLERKHPDRWKRRDLHEVQAVAAQEQRQDEDALLSGAGQGAIEAALDGELEATRAQLPPGD